MMREGVLLLMFDVPCNDPKERREYAKFRRNILKSGFLPMQKSIYVKMLRNISSAASEAQKIGQNAPKGSEICVLPLSLGNFKSAITVSGAPIDFAMICDEIFVF